MAPKKRKPRLVKNKRKRRKKEVISSARRPNKNYRRTGARKKTPLLILTEGEILTEVAHV